jgi:polyisoprenoid-binding protein YceI
VARRNVRWLVAAPVAVVALLAGGGWFYTHVVEGKAPDRLALSEASPSATSGTTSGGTAASADGTWTVTGDSQVGYRVDEVLFGSHATAVGRTGKVTGSLTVAGTKVTAATFTVDMASVSSDRERRDGQYRDRIMETGTYPTSSFTLTQPIDLGAVPASGATVTARATGKLTLHGQTKDVTFDLKARRTGTTVEVNGTIPVVFADWGIPDPSFGPAQVEDHGELEFLLVFAK